jgi:DNA repair protein RecO (recombination protein O)
LTLAAGFAPELASCARCGEADGLVGFSGAAGGVVCSACEGGGFDLSAEAHRFMVEALGSPLASPREAGTRALRQVERAISETLEHHAHVRLRAAA